MDSKLIICCSDLDSSWKWISDSLNEKGLSWIFVSSTPKNIFERKIHYPALNRIRAAWQTIKKAKQTNPSLLIVHGPNLVFYTCLFAAIFRVNTPILACTFNFPILPKGLKRMAMRYFFKKVDRFVVFTSFEKNLYHEILDIPLEKIDVILWGVSPPEVAKKEPIITGRYISSIGGNARDYAILLKAMQLLPHIPLVLVVRPYNIAGLTLPPNVTVYENLPEPETFNIMQHSQLTIVPLKNSETPCGHVTIVAAMYLGVPVLITDSQGINEYIQDGYNGLKFSSIPSLVQAIENLWSRPEKCKELGNNGKIFASTNCTENNVIQHLKNYLHSIK